MRALRPALLRLGIFSALVWFVGCSSAEFEACNHRLENARLLFLHDGKFDVIAPPLFASAGEYNAHLSGRTDAYERRFQKGFPGEQEAWFARFRPVDDLPAELRRDADRATVGARRAPAGRAADAPAAPLKYYLIPLEGVEAAFVDQVEQSVRAAGLGCIPNKPGDATQLPMPPRGGNTPTPGRDDVRVR